MLAILMAPLTLVVCVNVAITFSKVRETLDAVPASAAKVSRQAIYATLVGAARYGIAIGDGAAHGGLANEFLEHSLARNPGYAALLVRIGGRADFAVRPEDRGRAASIEKLIEAAPADAPDFVGSSFPAEAWFRPIKIGAERSFSVRVKYGPPSDVREVVIVIGDEMMRRILDSIDDNTGAQITLVDNELRPLNHTSNEDWLPLGPVNLAGANGSLIAKGRDGRTRVYGVKQLAGPHAYVLAALDSSATSGLRAQLPIAFLVPLLALALISFAFLRTLKTNVSDWIYGLDRDVRRSKMNSDARAIVSSRMPIEIENVARSFNEVLDARNAREAELSSALLRNRALTRELHHRVKNSLQLVQSYLALGAREAKGPARAALAAAQCRAYILSSAYRRALAEGEMRPFEVDAFLGDVASYSSEILRAPRQRVDRLFRTDALAGIDEALPLGMIVVELIENCLRSPSVTLVKVSVVAMGGGAAAIAAIVEPPETIPPAGRLLSGLLRQIGAEPARSAGAESVYRFELSPPTPDEASRDPTHALPVARTEGNRTPPRTL